MDEDRSRERLQRTLVKTVMALPLLDKINAENGRGSSPDGPTEYEVIIDVHLDFPAGRKEAREWIQDALAALLRSDRKDPRLKPGKNEDQPQYVFARLTADTMLNLVTCDGLSRESLEKEATRLRLSGGLPAKSVPNSWPLTGGMPRAIYQIWEDFKVIPLISTSISTVKADAAQAAFKAAGKDIVWAVIDSGVDGNHPHFAKHGNLKGTVEGWHRDFTGENPGKDAVAALRDDYGHGTHVAGIIAGEIPRADNGPSSNPGICAYTRFLEPDAAPGEREVAVKPVTIESISGMAPRAGLVSLKVLDHLGRGNVSNIIAALTWVQEINGYGRRIRIHGVNLSVGYPFDPEWFACGQSQLCVEVDRLVRSGVAVVVAAGNSGYGTLAVESLGARKAGLPLTINDPGNAELAITVGSTHREMPHIYGVSYFSGKGPTGDGRLKPDLLAPGEKVLSCAAGKLLQDVQAKLPPGSNTPNYIEYTGTSMAAPHVSGCVAAFLSVKREFIGRPERVKEVFLKTATDLGRERTFQGAGLVDLMRAIQHV
ncbi:MAG TPA: S8 family peptidase [Steroidobacteraceae bacterium]|nr:S8 family peptidase [Steroidobacteraceae bacterium]